MKKKILTFFLCGVMILGLTGCGANSKETYKEVTVAEFKNAATKNGYFILDSSYYDNLEQMKEVSDYAVGFYTDKDGALEFKVEFYEFKKQEELDKYYKQAIEYLKNWNNETPTVNESKGNNYKKCEIKNKYGYGIVINVGNTLLISYGYEEELSKLINELYK